MTKVHSRLAACAVAVIVGVLGLAAGAAAAASLGAGTYSQNFDTLASTGTSAVLPVGWALSESGTSANVNGQYTAGTGSSNAGDVYSYGATASTDRAFGTLLSGTLTPIIGASFTNDTGATIGSLNVAYTGEEWRLGTSARGADRLDFQYNLTATDLVSLAGWIDVDGLDFSSPVTVGTVGALDGNAAANRTAVAATISGLSVAPGQTIWIRWTDFNATGADDGLGIDDFSISTGEPTEEAPRVVSTVPADGASDVALDANVTITFSEPVNVTGEWFGILCGLSETHVPSDTPVTGGPTTFTLNPDSNFGASLTCTVTVKASQVADQDTTDPPDNMATNHTFTFTTAAPPPPAVAIHDIQGASHTSPKVGTSVSNVNGIVTAKRSNGFYMQDPVPDADEATSEGIFVFTSSAPSSVNVGDALGVNGNVTEFRPGGSSSTNLTITEIGSPAITVLSSGNTLPPPTVIGNGGRIAPNQIIEDDAAGSVETSGVFDPATDGIDFYESLEGMRLQINNPVVVGPRSSFGEIFVLADNGAGASVRTARDGILLRGNDANPERIQFDDAILAGSTPNASVGDHFTSPAVGILDYDFGNFELNLTSALTTVSAGLAREVTAVSDANQLAVATFNVENLDANEPQSKFDALAGEIVTNLRSPDVISLEEIQDNNGATNDSVVDASQTYAKLIGAISTAGGPTYDFRQINPVDDQDGGEPGGNIRVGFLFRTDRGLTFTDRPGGDSTTPTTIEDEAGKPRLSASPGRIAPANTAWNSSRKPLAGEFTFRGQTFFMIANHFNSKGGDHPLFGRFQPPVRSSETQRHQQAQLVNDFVDSILAVDANAKVIVLGDINDFEFSQTVSLLRGTPPVLEDLMDTLPEAERYSYVFEGNSQVLDHIIVSNGLFTSPFVFDPVHVNAEFFDQLSDHDPSVARFTFIVTFDSLCALVRAYSSDPIVADTLCAKLAQAADAPTATARAGHLTAFRNQVDAKTGKAFTPEQAALLKQLSTEL